MSDMPHTAMVLAAGLGKRMRPLTETTAKPLLSVGERSLIDRALDELVAAGVKRAVVNVHWCADKVEAHVLARSDIDIVISDERAAALETGGGLAKARPLLGDDPIFVVNTDAFWAPPSPEPLLAMAKAFCPDRMDGLLLLADTQRCLGFPGAGDFFLGEDGRLTRRGGAASAPWAYAGLRIIKPQSFDDEPVEAFSVLRKWDVSIAAGRLYGHCLDRFWLHVGTPDALADAEIWLRCHGG
ncbi:MAG: nucleotidyltransferase family protein [Pseudomonadota bacterium]